MCHVRRVHVAECPMESYLTHSALCDGYSHCFGGVFLGTKLHLQAAYSNLLSALVGWW